MTRLVQAVMLLEGIGVRGEVQMDRQVAPLRRAGMEYFGYDDQDEFMTFVSEVCFAMLAVFLGTVVWLMWDSWTAGREPEEEPYAEPPEPQQRLVEPPEAQQQVEPAEAQQQVEPAEAQHPEPAGEPARGPDPRVRLPQGQPQGQQQQRGPQEVPEEVRQRFNNWMQEQLDEAHLQRVRAEYQQRVQRDAIMVRITRTGVCFHSENCPRLRHHRPNQLRVVSRGVAEARGYRQCDQCRG